MNRVQWIGYQGIALLLHVTHHKRCFFTSWSKVGLLLLIRVAIHKMTFNPYYVRYGYCSHHVIQQVNDMISDPYDKRVQPLEIGTALWTLGHFHIFLPASRHQVKIKTSHTNNYFNLYTHTVIAKFYWYNHILIILLYVSLPRYHDIKYKYRAFFSPVFPTTLL